MYKVLIADDHPLFRAALKEVLSEMETPCEIIEAGSYEEAKVMAHDDLDLILLDLMMPDAKGFNVLIALRAQVPSVPIMIVSAREETETIKSAGTYGASGFLPKSSSEETIASAINAVLNGSTFWGTGLDQPVAETNDEDSLARLKSLTPSEAKVLALMSEGHLNKQIAFMLDIKESTVKSHITAILRKLNVYSRTQAVLAAQKLGTEE